MEDSLKDNIRVALYARVSTEEQREGQTIDSQIAELERFARERTWIITGLYKDDGWSGALLARPELDRLRDDASKRLFQTVLVNDVDRLARDVSHLGIIKRDLERHGVQVVFRKLPAGNSPTHNLMVNVLGSFAEFERELIADRTRRGRRHKVEVRKQFHGAIAPYGYRRVPNAGATKDVGLEIHPEEAAVVRQIFTWLGQDGLSARAVTQRLNDLGVRPRKGRAWEKSIIIRIVRNETYAGLWHFGKTETCLPPTAQADKKYRRSLKSSHRRRPRDEWIPLELPEPLRLISPELWTRAQHQLAQNLAFSPRRARHPYLLSGLIRCGGCGSRYVGQPCYGRYFYRCLRRCDGLATLREDYLDGPVWNALKSTLLHPEVVISQVTQASGQSRVQEEKVREEAKEIAKALERMQSEEARLLEAYRLAIISPDQLRDELAALKGRRAVLHERQDSLPRSLPAEALSVISRSVEDYCREAATRLASTAFDVRRRLLRLLVKEIILEDGNVCIKAIFPVSGALVAQNVGAHFSGYLVPAIAGTNA